MSLDPDLRNLLDMIAAGGGYEIGTGSVDQDRAAMRLATQGQEPPAEVHRTEDLEIPGADGALPARGYWPSDDPDLPLVLFWHGGGWQMGDIDGVDRPVRSLVARADVAVISTTHRLAPEHPYPAAVDDGLAALRWVGDHAEELQGRPDRIIVAGESSGANVAAAVALRARDAGGPPIAHQFLINPTTDADLATPSGVAYGEGHVLTNSVRHLTWRRYLGDAYARALDEGDFDALPQDAAVLRAPDLGGLPATTMIACGCDPHYDEDVAYATRLERAGVPTRLARFENLTHGALNFAGVVPAARAYAEAVAALLAEAAGPPPAR